MKDYDVRVPGRLLIAPLPGWIKLVWIAVRSIQGKNRTCRASLRMIGERCRSEHGSMDKGQVSRAIARLIADGWMLRDGRELRCCRPENVDEESTKATVDEWSTLTPRQRSLTSGQRNVDEESTPSENQKKTKRKTKKEGTRKRDPLLKDPRVMAYREIAHLTANHQQRAQIVATVDDESRWRGTLIDWMSHGWNPKNVSGMLNRYLNPNRNGHAPRTTADRRSAVERASQLTVDEIAPAYLGAAQDLAARCGGNDGRAGAPGASNRPALVSGSDHGHG